jgi:hypothetical protein
MKFRNRSSSYAQSRLRGPKLNVRPGMSRNVAAGLTAGAALAGIDLGVWNAARRAEKRHLGSPPITG